MDLASFIAGGLAVVIATTAVKIRDHFFAKIKIEQERIPFSIDEDDEEEEEEEVPVKKIPAKYSLTEDDIKEAIKDWLYNNHDVEDNGITVTFHVETKQEQPDTPYRGGMSDWVDKTIITATAEESD